MSSISLWASFSSFSHWWRKKQNLHYNYTVLYQCIICVIMNLGQIFSYSKSLKSKRGWLHTADKSKEHIHHGWRINMLQDQGEESLLRLQKTNHLNRTEETPQHKIWKWITETLMSTVVIGVISGKNIILSKWDIVSRKTSWYKRRMLQRVSTH